MEETPKKSSNVILTIKVLAIGGLLFVFLWVLDKGIPG